MAKLVSTNDNLDPSQPTTRHSCASKLQRPLTEYKKARIRKLPGAKEVADDRSFSRGA